MEEIKRNDKGFIDIEVKQLINWNGGNGEGCMISDKITKEGWKVGYMYREKPSQNYPDSGWKFLKGDEDENYMNDPNNFHIFAINTICNYDSDIITYLNSPVGTALIRIDNNKFIIDDKTMPIYFTKQSIFNK